MAAPRPAREEERRILHVFLPYLSTDRLAKRGHGAPDGVPFVAIAKVRGAVLVDAVDPVAEAAGLQTGQPLAEARAQHPDIVVQQADPAADAAALTALARAADRYTPLVGLDPPHGLFLDISGCSHLFGGEENLASDLKERFAAWGFATRLAVAESPALAWGLARCLAGDNGPVVAPTGEGLGAILCAPVEALRLDADAVAVLHRLGLKSVGEVLRQPRVPLVRRFGKALARRIDQIEGAEREPITPLMPLPPFLAERRFAEPLMQMEAVSQVVAALAERLSVSLTRRGEGARRLAVRLFHTDGMVREATVGASEPLADPVRIAKLFGPQLEALSQRVETDCGIDMVRLLAEETGRRTARQGDLTARGGAVADLASLIDTLSERFGPEAVQRFLHVDTHQPDEAAATVPARDALEPPAWPAPEPTAETLETGAPPPERPLKLLTSPELVETLASVPDGPPVRFVWRRVSYHVAAAEGPERIAPPWWADDKGEGIAARTCDYFRVEDDEGRRFWMFRRGLYGAAEPPRWYVHGLFA